MEKRVEVKVHCPHCGHSLMDTKEFINNAETIFLKIKTEEGTKGEIRLSSIYGDFNYTSDVPIAEDSVVKFYCPHCGKNLRRRKVECDDCFAPVVSFKCSIGGRISICSREGCKNHYVIFENPDVAVKKFYSEYGYH